MNPISPKKDPAVGNPTGGELQENSDALPTGPGHVPPHSLAAYPSSRFTPVASHDEEINLIDLCLILVRHRWVLAGVTGLVAMGATLYPFLQIPLYEMRSTIEIGIVESGGRMENIETAATVVAKLKNSYIPLIQNRHFDDDQARYNINVSAPQNSNLILLTSHIPIESTERYHTIHNQVVNMLLDDHQRRYAVIRSILESEIRQNAAKLEDLQNEVVLSVQMIALETRLNTAHVAMQRLEDPRSFMAVHKEQQNIVQNAKLKLASLEDEAGLLRSQMNQLETQTKLTEIRIKELKERMTIIHETRRRAISEATDEARAMTLLMLDNEIRHSTDQLAVLEESVQVGFPNEQAKLTKKFSDNQRGQAQQREAIVAAEANLTKFLQEQELAKKLLENEVPELIAQREVLLTLHQDEIRKQQKILQDIQARLDNLNETRLLGEPVRSIDSINTSRWKILIFGVAIGLLLGVIAAFIAEFINRARSRQENQTAYGM